MTALATAVLRVDRNPERVLEIGCGEGEGVLFLAREFPQSRIRGVDREETAVRAATGRIGLDPEGRVAFKHHKGRRLPYPDDFFDLVAQRRGSLLPKEIARVLRPSGHLVYVLGEPHRSRLGTSARRLERALRRAGFEAVQIGEVAGTRFCVGQLRGESAASPD